MARLVEEHAERAADDGDHARRQAPAGARASAPRVRLGVTDSSGLFTMVAALSWAGLVAAPLLISAALDAPMSGAPLLGVVLWLGLLRVARWLSPPARADALALHGRYAEALAVCDQSLAVTGAGAWIGRRRLLWLNRRVAALLGLGRYDEALAAALDALDVSPDPETFANCALTLLRLNRYDLAVEMAREAGALTHGRSVRANATLAWAMLARGLPAEAEALARVSLADLQALTPYVRRENHIATLTALCRAQRALGLTRQANATLARLRRIARGAPALAAVMLLEEAGFREDDAERAAELVTRAHACDPLYTGWYLMQPDALAFLRTAPTVAPLIARAEADLARMNAHTPDDEVLRRLLGWARLNAHASPTHQSSGSALATQLITLGATLALLLFWMWRFFISQSL